MSTSVNSNRLEEVEEMAPRDPIARHDATVVVLRPRAAGNDEIQEEVAPARRAASIGQIVVAAIRAASAVTRQAHLRFRQRAEAAANYDTLRRLDDRTLHDIGFDRSEIGWGAAEVREEVEYADLRALWKLYRLK
jgi:uncharacterized protein YjiS (DUF1127 family)